MFSDSFEPELCRSAQDHSPQSILQEVPEYYAKYTSVVTQDSADSAFEAVKSFLSDQKHCTFIPCQQEGKIQGMLSTRAQPSMFTIQLFECSGPFTPQDGGILVECTRARGCPHTFQGLYRQIEALFNPSTHISRSPFLQRPALDLSFAPNADTDTDADEGMDISHSLLDMASSSALELQLEGLAALSDFSKNVQQQQFLLSSLSTLLTVILSALKSDDHVSQRSGAILLNNLAAQPRIQTALASDEQGLATALNACLQRMQGTELTNTKTMYANDDSCYYPQSNFTLLLQAQIKEQLRSVTTKALICA